MKEGGPASCADKLKVLADVTRLSVMEALLAAPLTVSQLLEKVKIEQSLLSHHLKVLRDAGLVTASREGKAVRYAVAPDAVKAVSGKELNLGCCVLSFPVERRKPKA